MASPNLAISVNACEIHSTGSMSGSTFSIDSTPLSGVVSLGLRQLTYLRSSPWLFRALADNLSAQPLEVILWYLINGSIYPRFEISHIHLFALIVAGPFTIVRENRKFNLPKFCCSFKPENLY